MSPKSSGHIPVVEVDQAFPAMVGSSSGSKSVVTSDQGPVVRAAIRDVLGVRSRREDPKAFTDALTAAFRLVVVEGHVESEFVPRGYAIQADLGAVTGGQASLYRRATVSRTEILRILDGLTPLRTDGDPQDMDAYRTIVHNAVQTLVDEMGSPGGPRVGMVDAYFTGLCGGAPGTPDTIGGQLGALRDRFGLIDDNVNTIEEEGLRTAYWTLVDMISDLKDAWDSQSVHFGGGNGDGFLGTELILLSRLMEAAADQVDELEDVLDSVLIPQSERQTIQLSDESNLTLDGLITWLRSFLSDEGRRLAQDAGRDGIVAALAPTAVALAVTFKGALADPILPTDPIQNRLPIRYLEAGCCRRWPPGMFAARVQIAVSSLCRLLMELARTAQRIGRWAGVVLIDVAISDVTNYVDDGVGTEAVSVEARGMNLRPSYVVGFVKQETRALGRDCCRAEDLTRDDLILPMDLSATVDADSASALFNRSEVAAFLEAEAHISIDEDGLVLPAADVPVAVLDLETGRVVHAPWPRTWPRLTRADRPRPIEERRKEQAQEKWIQPDYDFDIRPAFVPDDDVEDDEDVTEISTRINDALNTADGLVARAEAERADLLAQIKANRAEYEQAVGAKKAIDEEIQVQTQVADSASGAKKTKAAEDVKRLRTQARRAESDLKRLTQAVADSEAELEAAETHIKALHQILDGTRGVHDILGRKASTSGTMSKEH